MKKLDFKTAFKYPFKRAKGMWNILWLLLPIVGWFALGGYKVRIVKEFSKGKFKKLPIFKFKSDLKLGFMMFLKALPFAFSYILVSKVISKFFGILDSEWMAGFVKTFFEIFAIPVLAINFFNKETAGSLFEFGIIKSVFTNFEDYIVAILKSILLELVFFVMWIVIVGLPAGAFTRNIFLADFYRRKVK